MSIDLHLHSRFSDGTFTPEEVVAQARQHALSALSLTDHDTLEGCDRMAAACAANGIEFATGAEFTAEWEESEVHLLAYFLDPQCPRLGRELAQFQRVRQDRVREMVDRLNALHVPLAADAVFALADCQAPGRPHVARALVREGHCRSLDEAFERFLKKHRPAWVPKHKISAPAAIELIHEASGLAVIAHPGLTHSDPLVPALVESGLDGLECFHPKHSRTATQHYLALAEHFGLLVTGGSDCHGLSKGKPLIGTVRVPDEYFARLKTRAAERRASSQSVPAACPVAEAEGEKLT